jgi:hypothetical protein
VRHKAFHRFFVDADQQGIVGIDEVAYAEWRRELVANVRKISVMRIV